MILDVPAQLVHPKTLSAPPETSPAKWGGAKHVGKGITYKDVANYLFRNKARHRKWAVFLISCGEAMPGRYSRTFATVPGTNL